MWRHKWHGLTPDDQVKGSQSPHDLLTLWRGFRPDQLDPERGMLSSDALAGKNDAIAKVIQAINEGDLGYVCEQIRVHAHNDYAEQHSLTTPFVSVAPTEQGARGYCRGPGEMIAKLSIRADRVIGGTLWGNQSELLVLGGISTEEIVAIDLGIPPQPEIAKNQYQRSQPLSLIAGLGIL